MKTLYSIQEYAKRVSTQRSYIYKLIGLEKIKPVTKNGKLWKSKKDGSKFIDPETADPVLRYQEAGRIKRSKGKGVDISSIPEKAEDLPPLEPESGEIALEVIKLYEQARKLRIANDRDEGKTAYKSEINEWLFEVHRRFRDSLESLSDRLPPLLEGQPAFDVGIILKKEFKKTLDILKDRVLE